MTWWWWWWWRLFFRGFVTARLWQNKTYSTQCNAAHLYLLSQLCCTVPPLTCFVFVIITWLQIRKNSLVARTWRERSSANLVCENVIYLILHANHYNCKSNAIDELTLSLGCLWRNVTSWKMPSFQNLAFYHQLVMKNCHGYALRTPYKSFLNWLGSLR